MNVVFLCLWTGFIRFIQNQERCNSNNPIVLHHFVAAVVLVVLVLVIFVDVVVVVPAVIVVVVLSIGIALFAVMIVKEWQGKRRGKQL